MWCRAVVAIFLLWTTGSWSSSICPEFPQCNCFPTADKFSINCINMSNLTDIHILLETHFENRLIYQLSLYKCFVTHIPDGIFDNFSISILVTRCPIEDIETNALRHVPTLERVALYDTKFTEIPSGLLNLTTVTSLHIEGGNITTVTNELNGLKSLSFLTISKCPMDGLAEDAFRENGGLLKLDLSNNEFRFFYENTFDPLKLLQALSLKSNHLHSIDGLLKNLNLRTLIIYNNSLTSIEKAFPQRMGMLELLDLGRNPIPFLNTSSLAKKIQNLKTLLLTASKFTTLDPWLIKRFPRLESIDLSQNRIITIPDGFFLNMLNLQEIDLSSNQIISISGAFYNCPKLRSLRLRFNVIESISSAFRYLPQLTELKIEKNQIKRIDVDDLRDTPLLTNISLRRNYLYGLHSECFSGLTNLQHMEISNNKFSNFNYSIKNLYSLNNMSSKSGRLLYIKDDEMINLPKLQYLNLVDNQLRQVNGAFRALLNLEYLNLAKNKLTTLSRDTFPPVIKLQQLFLGSGNKLVCDCRLLWLGKWLNSTSQDVLADEPLCHLPMHLRGIPLRNLTANELSSWPELCPEQCLCRCRPQNRDFYVQVDCSKKSLISVPDVLPKFLGELDLQDNLLSDLSISDQEIIQGLQVLQLTNNQIQNFNVSLPKSLRVLTLDGNLLSKFPQNSIGRNNSLKVMKLSSNPWICDCETIQFKRWLLAAGDLVVDGNNVRCADDVQNGLLRNKVIKHLSDSDLCPSKISLYVSIAIGTLAFLLMSVSVVFMYFRYKLYIKAWLYANGLTWVKEEDLDENKTFDALLSYAEENRMFALYTIAPGLESFEPKFRLCIPERDILAGIDDVDIMLTSLEHCKRIIVILSKAYLNDQFAVQAFRNAFSMSLKDKVHRLIIVQHGKISEQAKMDPVIKTVLKTSKPIVWRESMFWERLRYALPKKKPAQLASTEEQAPNLSESVPEEVHCSEDEKLLS